MQQFTGLLGILVLLGVAFALSTDRRRVSVRLVVAGVLLQASLAFLLLRFPPVVAAFDLLARGVTRVISFADEGTRFIFGNLADPSGAWGFVFAVRVLPVIVFFAALMSVLYHLGVMQRVVAGVAWVIRRTLGVSGAEALSAAANMFVGQTEAPLTIKPFIGRMTRSQIMAVMTGGFATIAGSVMAAYIGLLGDAYAQAMNLATEDGRTLFAKHLITASVLSAPAGLVMAKIMLPERDEVPVESLGALLRERPGTRNVLDAATVGATDGLRLALNVAAMLVAFVALIALINWPLAALSDLGPVRTLREQWGVPVLTFQNILGYVFTPVGWLMGVAWKDAHDVGTLLGQQVVATEFVAYLDLARMAREQQIDARTAQIATYALCGFANLASIGIQIGGLSAIAPERRSDFASLAPRAMLAGAMACWMTGCIASVFIPI